MTIYWLVILISDEIKINMSLHAFEGFSLTKLLLELYFIYVTLFTLGFLFCFVLKYVCNIHNKMAVWLALQYET